jgi:hypothetical protein
MLSLDNFGSRSLYPPPQTALYELRTYTLRAGAMASGRK